MREGSYAFHGVSETTMTHGEGWRFVQLGKFTERACAVSMLLDAYFSTPSEADDLDWIALLASCAAFDSYCKVFTADLQPRSDRRRCCWCIRSSPTRCATRSSGCTCRSRRSWRSPTRASAAHIERIIGRLRSSLAFTPMAELLAGDLHAFLNGVLDQCAALHVAVHDAYIDYPIEMAFES